MPGDASIRRRPPSRTLREQDMINIGLEDPRFAPLFMIVPAIIMVLLIALTISLLVFLTVSILAASYIGSRSFT